MIQRENQRAGRLSRPFHVTIVPVPLPASTQAEIATVPEPMLLHVGNAFRIEISGDFAAPVLEKLLRILTRL